MWLAGRIARSGCPALGPFQPIRRPTRRMGFIPPFAGNPSQSALHLMENSPCLGCNGPTATPRALRCRTCEDRRRRDSHTTPFCPGCGAQVARPGNRCRPCSYPRRKPGHIPAPTPRCGCGKKLSRRASKRCIPCHQLSVHGSVCEKCGRPVPKDARRCELHYLVPVPVPPKVEIVSRPSSPSPKRDSIASIMSDLHAHWQSD